MKMLLLVQVLPVGLTKQVTSFPIYAQPVQEYLARMLAVS